MNHKKESGTSRILSMVYCSFFAIIIALCSYITIPIIIPFTLQTLGVFTALELLGGKRAFFLFFCIFFWAPWASLFFQASAAVSEFCLATQAVTF